MHAESGQRAELVISREAVTRISITSAGSLPLFLSLISLSLFVFLCNKVHYGRDRGSSRFHVARAIFVLPSFPWPSPFLALHLFVRLVCSLGGSNDAPRRASAARLRGNDKQRNEILMKYLSARPFFASVSPPTPRVSKKKSPGSTVKLEGVQGDRRRRNRKSFERGGGERNRRRKCFASDKNY